MWGATHTRPRANSAWGRPATPVSAAEPAGDRRLRINEELAIPLAEITLRASRSSGPGGQHANVTASRVQASFDVLGSRSLSDAQRERLLARALVVPKQRRATRPSTAVRERRLADKRRTAERKRERRPPEAGSGET